MVGCCEPAFTGRFVVSYRGPFVICLCLTGEHLSNNLGNLFLVSADGQETAVVSLLRAGWQRTGHYWVEEVVEPLNLFCLDFQARRAAGCLLGAIEGRRKWDIWWICYSYALFLDFQLRIWLWGLLFGC